MQCRREDILFNAITSKENYSVIGKHEFFEPLINSILEINRNPIKLSDGYFVTVNFLACMADMKASHHLQDISTSSRWLSCYICDVGHSDQLTNYHQTLNNHSADTNALHDSHVFQTIKQNGIIYAPDLFHILNEGIFFLIIILNFYFKF